MTDKEMLLMVYGALRMVQPVVSQQQQLDEVTEALKMHLHPEIDELEMGKRGEHE